MRKNPSNGTLADLRRDLKAHLSNAAWEEVVEFAETRVQRASKALGGNRTRSIVAVTRLAVWCVCEGFELTDETVFRRDIIDAGISHGFVGLSSSSKATMRTVLLRVGEQVAPGQHVYRLRSLPPSNPRAPYSKEELGELASWARSQPTSKRYQSAHALLALGAGCGLSAGEILAVRRKHLEFDSMGAVVTVVGARSRQVPVIGRWEEILIGSARELIEEDFLFIPGGRSETISNLTSFIYRSRVDGALPQTQRLRSTWIVAQIDGGTPMPSLVKAAGVSSLEALTRYLPFCADVTWDDQRAQLQLGGSIRPRPARH